MRVVDVAHPDIGSTGGILETKYVPAAAEACSTRVQFHVCSGPVSTAAARKAPTVFGVLLALGVIGYKYVSATWAVVFTMGLAHFAKGFGSLGLAVIADAAPRRIAGLTAGVFNTSPT